MVMKVFNIQPVLFHQYYLRFTFCENKLFFPCAFTFKFAILVHVLQEKIIVLLISTIIYNTYTYLRLKLNMDSLLLLLLLLIKKQLQENSRLQ